MHQASYALMHGFVGVYLTPQLPDTIPLQRVADVGAYDVNGTFKPLFANCEYVGIDLAAGPNIDRVVRPGDFGEGGFDVVVSGSCMEHVFDLHEWANQCVGLAKPGGLLCIVAQHTWHEHRFPVDCWRVFPDGMRWLFRDVEIIECRADVTDTICVARRHAFDHRTAGEISR